MTPNTNKLNHKLPDLGLRRESCKPTIFEVYDLVETPVWRERILELQRILTGKEYVRIERMIFVARK